MVETIATVLHNCLQQTNDAHYTPAGFVDCDDKSGAIIEGQWRKFIANNLRSVRRIRNPCHTKNALQIREVLADFFVSENGSVFCQCDHIRKTGN